METSIIFILEFWSQFGEEKPDLQKIFDIADKLFPTKFELDRYWTSLLQKKKNLSPKLLRLFSKFCIEIYNNKLLSYRYQLLAEKLEQLRSDQFELYHLIKANASIDNYEHGIVTMQIDDDKSGKILTLNNSIIFTFGYKRNELIGKNINILMPQVYADNHNDIIERFADTGLAVPKWKDKVVFGKSNTGYIFPLVINTRAIYNTIKDETIYFAEMFQQR